MLVFNNKVALNHHLEPFLRNGKSIGFVPTMGALHEGHLSLIKKAFAENDIVVTSIFVNPTQFNNAEDLEKYPRTLETDIEKVAVLSKEVIIYAPTVEDIYDTNTKSEHFEYDGLENQMEGKHRLGHFDGVGTIIKKLFKIIQPTKAYFGEKDFQQLQIVKKLVEKEKLGTEIIGCPIYREANGLAMSSRNERLSKEARKKAALIFETLQLAKAKFEKKSANKTIQIVENIFKKHPEFELEYFEIADESTLLPCKRKSNSRKYRGFIAVFIDNIRLIDNISLK